jgi:hypothetical protein
MILNTPLAIAMQRSSADNSVFRKISVRVLRTTRGLEIRISPIFAASMKCVSICIVTTAVAPLPARGSHAERPVCQRHQQPTLNEPAAVLVLGLRDDGIFTRFAGSAVPERPHQMKKSVVLDNRPAVFCQFPGTCISH